MKMPKKSYKSLSLFFLYHSFCCCSSIIMAQPNVDSFYVFLSSATSTNNTDYFYTTQLSIPQHLRGDWRIGIAEIILPPTETYLSNEESSMEVDDDINIDQPNTVLIECDLVQPSLFENQYRPMLRRTHLFPAGTKEVYNPIQYMPLRTYDFEHVTIKVSYRNGTSPKFHNGLSECTLHFIRKQGQNSI
jgi:hypothetical protein